MKNRSRFVPTALAALGVILMLSSVRPSVVLASSPQNGIGAGSEALELALPSGAALIGTVVVEGGRSFALLSYANATWRLEEGETLVEGVRLKQVRSDRIILESASATKEILFASGTSAGGPSATPYSAQSPQEVSPGGTRDEGDVLDWVSPQKRDAAEKSLRMKERRMRYGRGIQVPEDAPPPQQ